MVTTGPRPVVHGTRTGTSGTAAVLRGEHDQRPVTGTRGRRATAARSGRTRDAGRRNGIQRRPRTATGRTLIRILRRKKRRRLRRKRRRRLRRVPRPGRGLGRRTPAGSTPAGTAAAGSTATGSSDPGSTNTGTTDTGTAAAGGPTGSTRSQARRRKQAPLGGAYVVVGRVSEDPLRVVQHPAAVEIGTVVVLRGELDHLRTGLREELQVQHALHEKPRARRRILDVDDPHLEVLAERLLEHLAAGVAPQVEHPLGRRIRGNRGRVQLVHAGEPAVVVHHGQVELHPQVLRRARHQVRVVHPIQPVAQHLEVPQRAQHPVRQGVLEPLPLVLVPAAGRVLPDPAGGPGQGIRPGLEYPAGRGVRAGSLHAQAAADRAVSGKLVLKVRDFVTVRVTEVVDLQIEWRSIITDINDLKYTESSVSSLCCSRIIGVQNVPHNVERLLAPCHTDDQVTELDRLGQFVHTKLGHDLERVRNLSPGGELHLIIRNLRYLDLAVKRIHVQPSVRIIEITSNAAGGHPGAASPRSSNLIQNVHKDAKQQSNTQQLCESTLSNLSSTRQCSP